MSLHAVVPPELEAGRGATNEIQFSKAVGQVKYGCIFVLLVKGQAEPLGVSVLPGKRTAKYGRILLRAIKNRQPQHRRRPAAWPGR